MSKLLATNRYLVCLLAGLAITTVVAYLSLESAVSSSQAFI